jgi:hypothetical protein
MSKLTYGDFYATGQQDCGNVLNTNDFTDEIIATDLSYPVAVAAEKIFDRAWNKDEEDIKDGWTEQADKEEIEEDGLDLDECFKQWAAGWRTCAIRAIEQYLKEHRDEVVESFGDGWRQRKKSKDVVYWYGDDSEVETVELNTFEAALEEIATRLVRKSGDASSIFVGDNDGPHETIARVERLDVSENDEAAAANAELVLTLDAVHHVPTRLVDVARSTHVVTLEYGPTRGRRGDRDQSIVYVQFVDADLENDATAQRFAALEFNPAKLRGLTAKGNKMYSHVLAAIGMRAEATKRGAPRAAAQAIVGAAKHGVPGLLRKNPPKASEWEEYYGQVLHVDDEHGCWDGKIIGVVDGKGFRVIPRGRNGKFTGAPRSVKYADTSGDTGGTCQRAKKNPASAEDREAAIDRYKTFHRYDPKDIGEFPTSFRIPERMRCVGPAKWTTYRSGKVDPSTLKKPKRPVNYIHEHDAGVEVYVPTSDREFDTDGEVVTVPTQFRDAGALVKLGESLGFCVKMEDDGEIECEHDAPLPELYCTTDGKCLLVIENKSEVKAMIWGGALGVFARGIDG